MSRRILVETEAGTWTAELNNSPTARRVWEALPIEASASRWGQELYFRIPVTAAPSEEAREVVERGELGYWPTGSAFCIFFGPTPASRGDECRAASPVNPLGHIVDSLEGLDAVSEGSSITLRRHHAANGEGA